jgi:hypothetical protein
LGSRRLTAAELGIETVDLTDTAGTKYSSNTIDVRNSFVYTVVIDVTETGSPSTGDFKLTIRCTDSAGTTTYEVDAVTAIDSQTSGSQTVFTWGSGTDPVVTGSGTLGSNLGVMKVFDYMEVVLEITTANDGTTSTADVILLLEDIP